MHLATMSNPQIVQLFSQRPSLLCNCHAAHRPFQLRLLPASLDMSELVSLHQVPTSDGVTLRLIQHLEQMVQCRSVLPTSEPHLVLVGGCIPVVLCVLAQGRRGIIV